MKKRRGISLIYLSLISFCICSSCIVTSCGLQKETNNLKLSDSTGEAAISYGSNSNQNKDRQALLVDNLTRLQSIIDYLMISPEESTKDNIVFTEYYAGSYLDQDENLVICFTKSLESSDKYNDSIIYLLKNFKSAEIVDQIKKLDNIDFSMMKSSALNNITYKEDLSDLKNVLYMDNLKSYIRFKTVEYSYNKIYRTQVIIEEKFKEYADLYSNEKTKEHELINSIAAISINLGQGLDIYIVDLNNDKINTFYSLFGNYKFLNFYNSENEDNLINSQRTYF